MATFFRLLFQSSSGGGSQLKPRELWSTKSHFIAKAPSIGNMEGDSNLFGNSPQVRMFVIGPVPLTGCPSPKCRLCETHNILASNKSGRGGGSDFVAGFVLGGAVLGTIAYIFAPQIRRSLLNEDEYGFRRAKRPIYYDEGLEKTRQTLNAKISQLNSAIDKVSSRLRGGNNSPPVPLEADPEVEATM
ncbi:hypothetical protein NC651_029433 [Populus alba x Populus x berolinensis]|nr:hypothetical protein NC651_029433 [Populus alba x Populus x berolinensis]